MEEVLPGIEDVAGGARLMKFMAKQATHKADSVELPDSHYT
jgi:hypothetical protein